MSRPAAVSFVGRSLAALALTVPMAGALLLTSVPTADAAITAPGNGAVFATHTTITIRAAYDRSTDENRLTLTSPGGSAVLVASSPAEAFEGGTLSYALDTGCWTHPSCSGDRPAPNGTWTLQQSGGATSSSTFVVRIPPRPPTNVKATARSPREVAINWTRGNEPDLTSFDVYEGDVAVVKGMSPSACQDATCSAVVSYPQDRPGSHSFVVRASRTSAPGSADTLTSASSASASATVPEPDPSPVPAPADSPVSGGGGSSGDGGTGGGAGGSATPGGGSSGAGSGGGATPEAGSSSSGTGAGAGGSGTSVAPSDASLASERRAALARSFSAFAPRLGVPSLPSSPLAPSIAEPLADGTFEPTLGFQDRVTQELVETGTERLAIPSAVSGVLGSEHLATSTAGALVLMLLAAHLRRWTTAPPEQ